MLACAAMVASFAIGVAILFDLLSLPGEERLYVTHGWEWISSGASASASICASTSCR